MPTGDHGDFAGNPCALGCPALRLYAYCFGPSAAAHRTGLTGVEESDDGMSMGGRVTYEDVASAKAAIDKYDGVDMGLGTTLELQAL